MRIPHEEYEKIVDIFGVTNLIPRIYGVFDEKGKEIRRYTVETYWMASLPRGRHNIMIAIVCTSMWHKGLLLPRPIPTDDELKRLGITGPVDLLDWPDPVAEALKEVNLFHDDPDPMSSISYELAVCTPNTYAELLLNDRPINEPSLVQLRQRLKTKPQSWAMFQAVIGGVLG